MAKKPDFSVKGTHVNTAKAWVNERQGEGSFAKHGRSLRVDWAGRVLPSTWYSLFELVRIVEQALHEIPDESVMSAFVQIARKNALDDLTSIYRAFLRLAGPKGLLNATPALWNAYCSFGDVVKIRNEAGISVVECHGIPPLLVEWACGAWTGFIPTAAEVAGGKNAEFTILEKGPDPYASGGEDLFYLRLQCTYDT